MLPALIAIPILAAVFIFLGSSARATALTAAIANLAILAASMTGVCNAPDFCLPIFTIPGISLSLSLSDGLSSIMALLTVIVSLSAILAIRATPKFEDEFAKNKKALYGGSLLISAGALGAFLSKDIFFFYGFHELALIPTFLLIGLCGRGNKKAAAWRATIYLALGSMILLVGLVWLTSCYKTFDIATLIARATESPLDAMSQKSIAALLLVGFGMLISLFPFHSWAAPAYGCAPAPVAMLHAGVLKKFGLYGLLKLWTVVPAGFSSLVGILVILLLGNIFWVGFVTINQRRLDLLLGNSSVMHMGYIFLAIASAFAIGTPQAIGIKAAALLMFGHGISIAMLFALADGVEKSTGTLEISRLGGLAQKAPALAFLFGIAGMASIGLPGLANFAGEVMVFFSGFEGWKPSQPFGIVQIATICAVWGLVISAVYMLRAYRNVFQGELVRATESSVDLTVLQRLPALILVSVLLVVGFYPNLILGFLN